VLQQTFYNSQGLMKMRTTGSGITIVAVIINALLICSGCQSTGKGHGDFCASADRVQPADSVDVIRYNVVPSFSFKAYFDNGERWGNFGGHGSIRDISAGPDKNLQWMFVFNEIGFEKVRYKTKVPFAYMTAVSSEYGELRGLQAITFFRETSDKEFGFMLLQIRTLIPFLISPLPARSVKKGDEIIETALNKIFESYSSGSLSRQNRIKSKVVGSVSIDNEKYVMLETAGNYQVLSTDLKSEEIDVRGYSLISKETGLAKIMLLEWGEGHRGLEDRGDKKHRSIKIELSAS